MQGLQVGEVTIQNQAAILPGNEGRIERISDPRGRDRDIANDHETTGWAREITAAQLKADGMRVNDVEVDITNNKLTVDCGLRHENNQTLLDIAVQECGTVEAAFEIAERNGLR